MAGKLWLKRACITKWLWFYNTQKSINQIMLFDKHFQSRFVLCLWFHLFNVTWFMSLALIVTIFHNNKPMSAISSFSQLCYPQMRLKLHPAPQLQTPSASADRAPSVSQIRPAKSANVVPSKFHLLLSWNGFQFHSLTLSPDKTVDIGQFHKTQDLRPMKTF